MLLLATILVTLLEGRAKGRPALLAPAPAPASSSCCDTELGTPAYKAMATISHQFAFHMIKQDITEFGDHDIALSPYSIMSVLQALSLGTRGETRTEIDVKLKYSSQNNHDIIKCSLENFKKESNVTVLVASRLFADEYLMSSLNPSFASDLKYYYDSDVEGVPFVMYPTTAWNTINNFVENKTQGVVSDFMNRWDSTELMYVNTIVFKGQWKHQFDKTKTKQGSFYLDPRVTINVPMMTVDSVFRSTTIEQFQYYGDNMKVIELPYSDDTYSMYIFMSEQGKLELSFIESIISKFTVPAFKNYYLKYQERPLRLVLPKFKISTEFDISKALYNIGVKQLFTSQADLSGIFTERNAHFNKMFHKSVIEVTEEGTVAAGATASYIDRAFQQQEKFIVNRPFVYVIHDACNNMVLFQGRYYGRDKP